MYRIADARDGFRAGDWPQGVPTVSGDPSKSEIAGGMSALLRPGISMARAWAHELLINEARNEIVFVKYLE